MAKLDELIIKNLDKLKEDNKRIKEIAEEGYISKRLSNYSSELTFMEFLSEGAIALFEYGEKKRAIKCLAGMKICIDCIARIFLRPEFLVEGAPDHYQALFDIAINKLKDSLDYFENRYRQIAQNN